MADEKETTEEEKETTEDVKKSKKDVKVLDKGVDDADDIASVCCTGSLAPLRS